jgi:DNA-binding CsgD family transcriptional regulator
VTIKTVEFHKAMIKRKLHLQTTAELIRYAIERKIIGT